MNDLDALLQKHGPPTLLYLLCRALGLTKTESAKRAGFSRGTAYNREQEPYWPGAMAIIQARLSKVDPTLLPLLPDAIRAYQDALEEADKSAARDVLDRVFGKPGVRKAQSEQAGELPPLIVLKGVDDTDED